MSFFENFIYLMYFCLTVLGLHCCAWAFSSCSEQVLLRCSVQASHCGGCSCGAQATGMHTSVLAVLSSCSMWAQ